MSDEIALAESTRSSYESQLANLEALLLDGWGNLEVYENYGGPNYQGAAALRAALADWSRVKGHLEKKLERARKALAEFERTLS